MKTLFFITIFLSLNYAQQLSDARVDAQRINIKWNNKVVEAFEGEFLVTLGDMKYLNSASNYLKNKADTEIIYNFDHLGVGCFKTKNKNLDIISLINELEKTGYFVNIEPNLVINLNYSPNDQYFNSHQWSLNQISSSYLTDDADIDLPQAWDITTGSENIIIAILDSGIPILNGNLSHEDLLGSKIILGTDFYGDGEGVKDRNGHGTHVAGIASASTNNSCGIAGVAPNCKLLIYQVFSETGNGSLQAFYSAVVAATDYKISNSGKKVVINFSGGGPSPSSYYTTAIEYARQNDIPIIIAAGNFDGDLEVQYPAKYSVNYNNVIAVSSTDRIDKRVNTSCFGPEVNVCAPGGDENNKIYSTTPNYTFFLGQTRGVTQNYGYINGTSMAAPHVSGLVALMLSIDNSLTPSQIRQSLQSYSDDLGPVGFDQEYGFGRINALRTLGNVFIQKYNSYVFNDNPLQGTRINENVVRQFTSAPRPDLAANHYLCDIYRYQISFNSADFASSQYWYYGPKGFSYANPNSSVLYMPETFNESEVTYTTYYYYIKSLYPPQGSINKWAPYTYDPNIHGSSKLASLVIPLVSPVIASITQNPVPIYKGTYGYVYCNLSQGNGNLTYNWFSYDQPSYVSIVPEGYRCKIIYHNTESMPPVDAPTWNLGCTVSNAPGAGWSDTETFVPSLNSDPNGCPTLAFEQNGNLVSENPLLITSMSNPGKDVTDYYLINTPLTPVNNKLNLTIHEPQTEHTWFDNVSLLETRANPDETIVVNDEGQVINYKGVLPARILLNGETDITQNLLELDSLSVELNPGDRLTISRNAVEGDGDVVLGGEEPPFAKDRPSLIMNILTENKVEDSEEIKTESIPITNFFLRPNKSIISKRLRNLPTGTIEITVNKKLTLDYFVFVSDLRTARTRELPLVSAVHNINGDVKTKLTGIDQNYSELYPTERIDLSFSTTITSGNRAYILKTVGRYETDTTFVAKQNKLAKLNEQPIIPTENKLYDNYPNPFNPTTIIKYSLKDDGKVTLKIYNSLGEEVRTIVNEIKSTGNYEVEFNASELPSGVYIYSIQAGEFVSSKKMILLK